jgi:hypothetical protein
MAEARQSAKRAKGATARSKPAKRASARKGGSAGAGKASSTSGKRPGGKGSTGAKAAASSPSGKAAKASSSTSSRRNGGMSALDVAGRARNQLQRLLGKPVEAVLGIDRDRGSWIVTVQALELVRIPNTTDVLGEYEALLDRDGEVMSYKRTRRYHRGHTDGGQG